MFQVFFAAFPVLLWLQISSSLSVLSAGRICTTCTRLLHSSSDRLDLFLLLFFFLPVQLSENLFLKQIRF